MKKETVKYRLGLDLGTNSIGWAAIKLDENDSPYGILDMGVRVFPDGREPARRGAGPSLAAERRDARGARRRRKRLVQRRNKLMRILIDCGLMPRDEEERKDLHLHKKRNAKSNRKGLDPYELRARALADPLEPYELGRALFHLNQRRGFKSNRKTEQRGDDTGPAKEAAKKLRAHMAELNCRTLGAFLYRRQRRGETVRFRNLSTGSKAEYEFYPTREMLLEEFNEIWEAQRPHHPDILTDEAKESIQSAIFYQRELISPPVGKCTFDPATSQEDADGFRCPWAHPLAQRFRIWQEVRNLVVEEVGQPSRKLRKDEGDKIASALFNVGNKAGTVTFNRIRKLLGLTSEARFNLESGKRESLLGDQTAARLSQEENFGSEWRDFSCEEQVKIVEQLLKQDDDAAAKWLTEHMEVKPERAKRIASVALPPGHCRLGLRAIRNMLPRMAEEGQDEHDAATCAGYDPSQAPTGELSLTGRLPYYGEWLKDRLAGTGDQEDTPEKRWGRFPNPTVHVGLGQLRLVVNALIKEYGPPYQMVVEMTRQFRLTKKQREGLEKEQSANQKKNKERNKKLKEEIGIANPKYRDRLKMRLWEELNPKNCLDRRCVFTGERISLAQLFNGDVEIEHLIPWQDSWEDNPANLTVSFMSANRLKSKRTPHEAFGESRDWDNILQRAKKLPKHKWWRFGCNAREEFKEQGGFLGRQLNETGWLSGLARSYLSAVVPWQRTWVSPGRLTATLRYKWGLNELLPGPSSNDAKKRTDHRHHAIDAFVVALTDRSLLQRMSRAYDETRKRIRVPPPWDGFHDELKRGIDGIVVSYKPNRPQPGKKRNAKTDTTSGQLHKETAYGLIGPAGDGLTRIVTRKPLATGADGWPKTRRSLEADGNGKERQWVRDAALRTALLELWDRVGGKQAEFVKQAATDGVIVGGRCQRVRSVRLVSKERVIPIRDEKGKPYKGYLSGDNAFADVWQLRGAKSKSGRVRTRWQIVVVSTFDANQPDFDTKDFRPLTSEGECAEWLTRLYVDDMVALGEGKERRVVRVRMMSGNHVWLDPHFEANVSARMGKDFTEGESKHSGPKLQRLGFRKLDVNAIGRVFDPGPRQA